MAKKQGSDSVSIAFWMLAIFVSWIPILNIVMVVYWALTGDNDSKKNYFKALIIWFIFGIALWLTLIFIGFSPYIGSWLAGFRKNLGL